MANYLLVVLVLLPALMVTVSCNLFNDVCGPAIHCNVTAGLICKAGRCSCTSKNITTQYDFDLTWDATRSICVGNKGSACVGTRTDPVPEGMKQVQCIEKHSCIQVPKFPRSLGICNEVPEVFGHGENCTTAGRTNLKFCDASRGLFCDPDINICTCSNGRVNTSPKYSLIWNEEFGCVGEIGSGCIGTMETKMSVGQKTVQCVPEAVCAKEMGQTPGVGICQRMDGSNSVERLGNNRITIGFFVLSYFSLYLFG